MQIVCYRKSTFVSVFTIKMPKGASAARTRGLLMVNILNKCILSILVYNLFLDKKRNISIHHNISIHWYIGCLHEIEIQIFKKNIQMKSNARAVTFL
mgnify:CR=1 FL=1